MRHSISRCGRPEGVVAAALPLLLITGVGAALRFFLLGHQGLWYDESLTAVEVRLPIPSLMWTVTHDEVTPPLYFLVSRLWLHVFGTSAFALRSLSAVAGTLAIPLGYLAGRWFTSRRAGLIAAALIAFNPFLFWYSQEARAYSLLVLCCALALAALAGARRFGDWRFIALWALGCGLAIATHFFAGFFVAPTAAWMLVRGRPRAVAWVATASVAGAQSALVPLALSRRSHGLAWIAHMSLAHRLAQIPEEFLIGFGSVASKPLLAVDGVVVLVALLLLFRTANRQERAGSVLAGAIGLSAVALPLALVAGGQDFLITRNVIIGLVPLLVMVAGGLGAARARALGPLLAIVLCAVGLVAIASVDAEPSLQRPDWRGLSRALGPARVPRAVVVSGRYLPFPLQLYLRRSSVLRRRAHPVGVREVTLVGTLPHERRGCWWGAVCNLPTAIPRLRPPAPGFSLAGVRRLGIFEIARFSSGPVEVLSRRQLYSPRLFRTRRPPRWLAFAQPSLGGSLTRQRALRPNRRVQRRRSHRRDRRS